jgi:hypothetical protein
MTSTAMGQRVDIEKLRAALRHMSRGNLLSIANRAIELVPQARLGSLVAGMVRLDLLIISEGTRDSATLLDEVRTFHDACLRGDYYESFAVNSKNYMDTSKGTDAFMVEFERLIDKCIRASARGRSSTVREAFELLFALLRRLDMDPDSVVFFADEGGSWQVGVDWRAALAAYFRCLADGTPAEHFAREVDRAIADFADYDCRSIWLPHGAWPARNRKWHFGLYLPASSTDHDGPEQPLAARIHGELRELGIAAAQSTVARYLPRPGKQPSQVAGEK